MDQDQTAPIGAVCFGSTLFVQKAFKTFQQTTYLKQTAFDVIGAFIKANISLLASCLIWIYACLHGSEIK